MREIYVEGHRWSHVLMLLVFQSKNVNEILKYIARVYMYTQQLASLCNDVH